MENTIFYGLSFAGVKRCVSNERERAFREEGMLMRDEEACLSADMSSLGLLILSSMSIYLTIGS